MRSYAREEKPHEDRDDFANLKKLSPYIWRYSRRVGMALACLLAAKLATVCIPLVLKGIIELATCRWIFQRAARHTICQSALQRYAPDVCRCT